MVTASPRTRYVAPAAGSTIVGCGRSNMGPPRDGSDVAHSTVRPAHPPPAAPPHFPHSPQQPRWGSTAVLSWVRTHPSRADLVIHVDATEHRGRTMQLEAPQSFGAALRQHREHA